MMRSLSEQILHCVNLAGDGRYTNAQIADMLGQTADWVEQILAAWEYNPKACLQPPKPVYQYDTTGRPKPMDPCSVITNMIYDSGPIKPAGSAAQRTDKTHGSADSPANRPVTFMYDSSGLVRIVRPTFMRTNMIHDPGNHRPIRGQDSQSK